LVYGLKRGKPFFAATVFFAKDRGKMFIIGAKHMFAGYDSYGTKYDNFPDTLFVNLRNKRTQQLTPYPIDIRIYKKEIIGALFFKAPDILIKELPDYQEYIIDTINHLVKRLSIRDRQVLGYGYSYPNVDLASLVNLPPKSYEGRIAGDLATYPVYKAYNSVTDTINHGVIDTKGAWGPGTSGGPVFILSDSLQRYIFLGISVAYGAEQGVGSILRSTHISRAFDDYHEK